MSTIQDIIEDIDTSGSLTLPERYTLNIKRGGTHDSIIFEDIEFNDFFVWNDDKLKIGDERIIAIQNSRSSTSSQSISIGLIKRIHFKNCTFNYLPSINNREIWNIEFKNCTFLESGNDWTTSILAPTHENKQVYINNCSIESFELGDIRHIQYNSNKELCYFELTGGSINDLTIHNIEIMSKFYINKQYRDNSKVTDITNLIIDNAIFQENFKLHHCNVGNVIIEDTDFEKHADFYRSTFNSGLSHTNDKSIYFKALNFRGLALFGDCTFNEKLCFMYVTFEDFSHFRRAKFKKGLDLDYCNIQKEMNFFGIKGLDGIHSKNNTSQETYRIIKHNFLKIGNTIEANKYQALELETNNKVIWNENKVSLELLSDGIVSFFNLISSYYARFWFIPLIWIFIVGLITSSLIENNMELANVVRYSTITKFDNKFIDNYPIIFLFNKAGLGYLYYQFIISIRKNTKK